MSPILDRLFRAHPHQGTQNAFSCRFYPTHAKNHYSHRNTCIAKLGVYTRSYKHIYSSSREIKDRIIKEAVQGSSTCIQSKALAILLSNA
jgi:hypothetical protein